MKLFLTLLTILGISSFAIAEDAKVAVEKTDAKKTEDTKVAAEKKDAKTTEEATDSEEKEEEKPACSKH